MKINCHIDPNLEEEHGELWIKEMTPKINDFLQVMSSSDDVLWCRYQAQIIPVKYQDIYSLEVASRETNIYTENQQLSYHDRLSNMKANLPNYFIEASRSAIFNFNYIDHLELLDNGLIDVVLTNNHRIQISRRNIRNLKERLGI
ncbi:MAG: LytTR family DNA-binding domain-containing protein [Lactobacillaceae bacterium]